MIYPRAHTTHNTRTPTTTRVIIMLYLLDGIHYGKNGHSSYYTHSRERAHGLVLVEHALIHVGILGVYNARGGWLIHLKRGT